MGAVTDASSVGEARRTALTAAQPARIRRDPLRRTRVACHGGFSQCSGARRRRAGCSCRELRDGGAALARILAIDKGAGIAKSRGCDERWLLDDRDHGRRLGRHEENGHQARNLYRAERHHRHDRVGNAGSQGKTLQIAGLAVPYPGERVCGDAWCSHQTAERTLTLLADGLGHGWGAAEAAQEAISTFQQRVDAGSRRNLELYARCATKNPRRGSGDCRDSAQGQIAIYAGVGNISGVVLTGGSIAQPCFAQRNAGNDGAEDPGVPL